MLSQQESVPIEEDRDDDEDWEERERLYQSSVLVFNPFNMFFPSLGSSPSPLVFSLIVDSNPTRESFLKSDYTEDEYIREADALTKSRPSEFRVAALSEQERWMLKNKSEAEQVT